MTMTLSEALAVLSYLREEASKQFHDTMLTKSERELAVIATAKAVIAESAQKTLRGF
jgi:hypothetical protein